MNGDFDLSVIIVTWNGWALTQAALRSLYASAGDKVRVEVLVADNGSTDGTRAALGREFPSARLIPFDENLGFAEANNRAARVATAPLVFLLNNDTVLEPEAIPELVAGARAHPTFDVFACQMIRMSAPDEVDNRGIYLDATAHCRQRDTGRAVGEGNRVVEVFGASGGACLIRRSLIERIGLFDATLGSYWEDCDFAFRSRARGARCLYLPRVRVRHVGSATGNRIPLRKRYLIQRNMLRVSRRWLPLSARAVSTWLFVAMEASYVVRAMLDGAGGTVMRAKRDALKEGPDGRHPSGACAAWIGIHSRGVDVDSGGRAGGR